MTRLLVPAFLLALAGCGEATDVVEIESTDGRDDTFMAVDGKADTGGVAEDSPEALGVLAVVNTASFTELDIDAGLDRRAAENIAYYRRGDDGRDNTSDDELFDDLAELDRIPFVGPVAFANLVAYAEAQGLVDRCARVVCRTSGPVCNGTDLEEVTASVCEPSTGQCVDTVSTQACAHGCSGDACLPDPATVSTVTASCNLYYGWHQRTDYCQMFGYGWLEEREITLQMEEVNGVLRVTVPAMEFEHVASTWGHMAELALPEFTAELDPQTQRWEDVVHYDRDRRAYNDYCGAVQKGTMRKDVSIWNQTLYFSESENVQTNACCGAPRRTILCEVDLAAP